MAAFVWQDWLIGLLLGAGFALLVGIASLRGIVGFVVVAATYIITQIWWAPVVFLVVTFVVAVYRDRESRYSLGAVTAFMVFAPIVYYMLALTELVKKRLKRLDPQRRGMSQTRVEVWFRLNFPDHKVEAGEIRNGGFPTVLFWAELLTPKTPRYELEITYEAFQDHDAQTIVNDLDSMEAAQRLRAQPTVRLMYNSHRKLWGTARHSSRW